MGTVRTGPTRSGKTSRCMAMAAGCWRAQIRSMPWRRQLHTKGGSPHHTTPHHATPLPFSFLHSIYLLMLAVWRGVDQHPHPPSTAAHALPRRAVGGPEGPFCVRRPRNTPRRHSIFALPLMGYEDSGVSGSRLTRFIGVSVCGSTSQARDHGLRTVRRRCGYYPALSRIPSSP